VTFFASPSFINVEEMNNISTRDNMCARKPPLRRLIFYLFIISTSIYIFTITRHSSSNQNSIQFTAPYNTYIDQNGNYLPYSGIKIVQFVTNPASQQFVELSGYLDQQSLLTAFFKLAPLKTYHVTLTNLKAKVSDNDKDLQLIKKEQAFLDKDVISTKCHGKQLLLIDKNEIRLEIELTNLNNVTELQKRWDGKLPDLIDQHCSSFYITLAHQYRDIPDKDIMFQLETVLKERKQFPTDIELDPIEICSYDNVINYKIIVPDSD
jgi:hypothetical protein